MRRITTAINNRIISYNIITTSASAFRMVTIKSVLAKWKEVANEEEDPRVEIQLTG